jgi:hypothetical protein
MRRLSGAPSATGQAKPDNNPDNRSRIAIKRRPRPKAENINQKKGLLKSRPFSVRFDNA